MNTTIMGRLKESISRQRQALQDWLHDSPAQTRTLRLGPAGEDAFKDHLHTLDHALEKAEDLTLGLCDVCHEYVDSSRLEMDYTASVCLAHMSREERARLENELELSQKVQRALLPHTVPEIRGLEIAAFSQPAHIVGGDYFDFLRFSDGSHGIAIADVMGKGMPASLLMASLQASLRTITPESTRPADILARLNYLFSHNIRLTKFVTFFLGRYDVDTGMLTYCNAGHNPPLVRRSDGSFHSLLPTGPAVGLVEHALFAQSTFPLQTGDQLLLYTDGVVETANAERELFGEERLRNLMGESANRSTQHVLSALRERLQKFRGTGSLADDMTVLALRVTG